MAFFRNLFGRADGPRAPAPAAATAADWRSRGNAALAQGDARQAARCYAQAVRADPGDPLGRLNLGYAQLAAGEPAPAAESLARAIALHRPDDDFLPDAYFLLGRAQAQLGDTAPALASLRQAADMRAGFAEPLAEGTRLLNELRRFGEALEWAQRLAAIEPTPQARLLLAQGLSRAGRLPEALALLDELAAQQPASVEALRGRGHVLLKLGRTQEALDTFTQVVALAGPVPDDLAHAAAALQAFGRFDEALEHYARALQVQPDHRVCLCNRVTVLMKQLRLREAIAAARDGIALCPQDADLHWNLGIAHLLLGEFQAGFEEYEWRWQISANPARRLLPQDSGPQWTGQDLHGCTIVLFAEQGFGDSFQLARYVRRVAALAESVFLLLPPGFGNLLDDLAPNCTRLSPGQAVPPFDYQCPLLSLPRAFGTTLDTIPADVPYLHASPQRTAQWRERLRAAGPGLAVGLVWSGNPGHSNDRNRSIPLAALHGLAGVGCTFASLQPEVREGDRQALLQWPGLLPLGLELRDFSDTAALVAALDLVITVDTSVAHLAGALGRPVWVLLPFCPDWRWLVGREDSPWYPTARLYRQPAAQQWEPVVERVRRDLQVLAGGSRP